MDRVPVGITNWDGGHPQALSLPFRRHALLWILALITGILVGGCKPKVDSDDPEKRMTAVRQVEDQTVLARLASEARYADVRQAAVTRLTDQAVLTSIAKKDKDKNVREAAVKKLINQASLAGVALRDGALDVCKAAVENLTDQALLVQVATETKYLEVRRTAVEKVTDQRFLVKWAFETKDTDFHNTIVRRITDQVALAKLAVEESDARVRAFAASILTDLMDQATLSKAALEDENEEVRFAAVSRLSDQTTLSKAALEDENEEVRFAAVSRLSDEAVLLRIAAETENWDLRKAVWSKLQRQEWAINPKVRDSDPNVRRSAVRGIQDPINLAVLATGGVYPFHQDVRAAAVSRIDDLGLLLILAGDLSRGTDTMVMSIARIKLAVRDPIIQGRIGPIEVEVAGKDIWQSYKADFTLGRVRGEEITVRLTRDGSTLAKRTWCTAFPDETWVPTDSMRFRNSWDVGWDPSGEGFFSKFLVASVHVGDLLTDLFSLPMFTPDDLRRLAGSKIPEVCQGAREALTNK